MTRSRRFNRPVLAVVAVATATVLTSCSGHPGDAAVAGPDSITQTRVDDVAAALCSAQGGAGGQGQALASRAARQGALDVLLNSTLSRQFGESQGVEPDQEQVSSALAANEQNIGALPAGQREDFRQALREYAEGQLMLIAVGRKELTAAGTSNVTEQQAVSEGTKLRNAWIAKNVKVSVDPRYGTFSKGALAAKNGSLSVAVSQRATDGGSPDPSAGWVAALPASQKCG